MSKKNDKNPPSVIGPPSSSFVPYGKQSIDQSDIDAVIDVLQSDFLTCGPAVEQFERALADYCAACHAVAVSNGTAALHVAMLAAGIGPGDRVLTSANTFLASANCAEFVGATADFADIDPETLCVSLETLKAAWKDDVKAVVAVDFAGYPCVTKEMADWIHEQGAIVIEDACHAIGGSLDDQKVGGFPWVDMTIFSFHPVKTMTTGEGGAIMTNDQALADCCRLFRNHGMVRKTEDGARKADPVAELSSVLGHPPSAPWLYAMTELGFNYRITDIQCALGMSQLKKLDRFVTRRQEVVDQYNDAFGHLSSVLCPPSVVPPGTPAWHLYVLQIDFDAIGKTRTGMMAELRERGVGTQVHYIPVHLQPYYREKHGYAPGKCPAAEACYQRCLSLPLYPAMTDDDVRCVVDAVMKTADV
ncbi:MAG: UDP-4-amino-4,6-dideoxy-N-acetyl-beta-L-altrosamine transaminase [Verrucomicrobia bacterium]|nr:UDP-4-amino-4,6-dideoxy-N-acetyl-beta-L-altrosamine transaminase [Verrucomicrobiota bacterium]